MKKISTVFTCLLFIMLMGWQGLQAQTVGELNEYDGRILETANQIKLYPNPTVEYLQVDIKNNKLDDVQFSVHNIIGNTITVNVEKIAEGKYKIKVDDLPPGYYLLAVKDDKTQFHETYKFLKKQ